MNIMFLILLCENNSYWSIFFLIGDKGLVTTSLIGTQTTFILDGWTLCYRDSLFTHPYLNNVYFQPSKIKLVLIDLRLKIKYCRFWLFLFMFILENFNSRNFRLINALLVFYNPSAIMQAWRRRNFKNSLLLSLNRFQRKKTQNYGSKDPM